MIFKDDALFLTAVRVVAKVSYFRDDDLYMQCRGATFKSSRDEEGEEF